MTRYYTTEMCRACDASMPRRKQRKNQRPAFWWNSEISAMRNSCKKQRRKAQRVRKRKRPEQEEEEDRYKDARKLLRNATKQSKRQCWKALCADVDRDSWDTPYRLVVRKLQTSQGSGAPKDVPTVDSTQDCISARMDGYIIQLHDSIRYLGVGSTGTGTSKTT